MRQSPIAARRSPYGSRVPDGRPPRAKATVRLSIFSATARSRPASVAGSTLPAESGRYCSPIAVADGRWIRREARVLRADLALEIGELAHELGSLIRLGEPCGLPRHLAAAESLDELDEACRLVRKAPGSGDEGDRAELLRERVDALRNISIEREARVVEPVLEDGGIAGENRLRLTTVGDDREACASEWEVPLMRLHCDDDHPLGQAEEALVEVALEDGRALDEMHDLVELPEWVRPVSETIEPLLDQAPPLRLVRLDARGSDRLEVRSGRGDLHNARAEAVPVRHPSRGDAVETDLHGLVVELRAQPANRTGEADVLTPRHRLRELEPTDERSEALRKHRGDLTARNRDTEEAVALLEHVCLDAVSTGESGRSALAQVNRRALYPLVGRSAGQVVHDDHEAPRPYEHMSRRGAEVGLSERRQLSLRLPARRGWKLLAADLKQQTRHSRKPPPRARARRRARPRSGRAS